MQKAKTPAAPVDVLVLGQHPSTYLAAALLRHKTKLHVMHAEIPDTASPDRLTPISPAFFKLHPLVNDLQEKLNLPAVHGLRFLDDDPTVSSEYRSTPPVAFISRLSRITAELIDIARAQQVEMIKPASVRILHLDETGIELALGNNRLRAKALIIGGELPRDQKTMLGIAEDWPSDIMHRLTFIRCKTGKNFPLPDDRVLPMSLDLRGELIWAWFLQGEGEFQLQLIQPSQTTSPASTRALLQHWCDLLKARRVIPQTFEFSPTAVKMIDVPLAGALAHEGVANRTLLIGPAGGFFSACSEDVYPNCWSAVYAADIMKKALTAPHLQDALNAYRLKWGASLGDYLRGPQQNLRFLLPLVYRNSVMTTRLAEAILFSKSVVR